MLDPVVFENYDAGEICAAKDVGLSGLRDSGLAFFCWMTERCPMQPWQLLLIGVAGWMNRKQQQVIEYLLEENRVLREQIGKKRLSLTDRQRRRLAGKAKVVGSKGLKEFARVATPQALLRWYRNLIAGKYDGSQKRGPGRLKTGEELGNWSYGWPRRTWAGGTRDSRERWPTLVMTSGRRPFERS